MPKNIVLLSDGTGNSSAKLFKTNVWRLYQILDLRDPTTQIAYYDDGVGTSSFKLFAILGGVFGIGLKRNVIDIYSFCCRNYKPGDKLYGFGFSRGAFTIRVVAGFIARIGLVRYDGNEAHLARDAETAYRAYRKQRDFKSGGNILIKPLRALRDWFSHSVLRKPSTAEMDLVPIETFDFLGVWDTVDAYGGPIEEITRAIDYYYWPLSMPDQFMNGKIGRACHALALEDERDAFRPVLWDDRYVRKGKRSPALGKGKELYPVTDDWQPSPADPSKPLADIDRERISQVWFVGVHSDIGGGYPQDGLSYKTLNWMMQRADIYGLKYLTVQDDWFQSLVGPFDKLNDSRHGLAGYYRYRPRRLSEIYSRPPYKLSLRQDYLHVLDLLHKRDDPEREVNAELAIPDSYTVRPVPKIHCSVIDRIARGTDGYAPIVLPGTFDIVNEDGSITSNVATPELAGQAEARASRQEEVWDWVWARRVTYFLAAFATFCLVALPLIDVWKPGAGPGSPAEVILPLIDVIAAFLPGFVKPWIDAIHNAPGRFVGGLVLVLGLLFLGGWLQGHIRDVMRGIWRTPNSPAVTPGGFVYRLRRAGAYVALFYVLKHWILPTLFAAFIFVTVIYAAVMAINRLSFAGFDAAGYVCSPSRSLQPVAAAGSPLSFETAGLCTSTGLVVQKNQTYDVTLTVTEPWRDGAIETGPQGFGAEKMTTAQWFGLPMRRLLSSHWFAPILRVGHTGFGEVALTYQRKDSPPCTCPASTTYTATLKTRRAGELFIYVNDAVIGWPGVFDYFYRHEAGRNRGKAEVMVRLAP